MGAVPEKVAAKTPETIAQVRKERITKIDQDIRLLSHAADSSKDESEMRATLEEDYQGEVDGLEAALGIISKESKQAIHGHMVDDQVRVERNRGARLDALEIEKLHLLLLTPEEEKAARESGKEINEIKKRSENGAEFIGRGFAHANTVEPMQPTVDALMQEDPDIVLIEGGLSLEDFYPGESLSEILKKDPARVIAEKGEEPYIALLAMREGKEVRTWDTRTIEQIREVLKLKDETTGEHKYGPQDVTDWMVTYAARRAHASYDENKPHESNVRPSADEIRRRSGVALSGGGVEEAVSLGIELTNENIDASLQRHMGFSLAELVKRFDDPELRKEDRARIIEMTEPQLVGERRVTSDVLRDMNIVRDEHAIDVFRELKKRYPDKKLFAIGGASHCTVWEPAIDELYKP